MHFTFFSETNRSGRIPAITTSLKFLNVPVVDYCIPSWSMPGININVYIANIRIHSDRYIQHTS